MLEARIERLEAVLESYIAKRGQEALERARIPGLDTKEL